MKRFKTKQEFENDPLVYTDKDGDYKHKTGKNCFVKDMRVLFGLSAEQGFRQELYPNLTDGYYCWTIEEWMITDLPHPYEGKNIKISVTPEQSEIVQKRAEAMGYKFVGSKGSRDRADHFIILGHKKDATWVWGPDKNDTELTFDQFCEGYWPEISAGTKSDAFIRTTGEPGCPKLYVWSGNSKVAISLDKAHHYNIVSEKDFFKKHPDKLTFKGYDVKEADACWKIGCVTVPKSTTMWFYETMKSLQGANVSVDEVCDLIDKNREYFKL